ncbi:hypothetical protein [Granulicella tundricola]|uniref:Uncharacterized protein n=1 Tax=Granulicella tundricola (strain ATCC BAA-1859 / DSM 23138 / MP5ACTX9) TaxID=1198114 RepID=E8X1T5_GRATM|nr:hypothetical protein [Granulicella tundricola]ADW68004.1 hypothetical protein AciX9_0937 [Granulicella tundricola MP5ACTX9]
MSVNPVLLIVWAVLAACFMAMLIYRGQLTRYEDEQLFLNDERDINAHEEQTEIVRKVTRLDPIVRILGSAAGLATASVIGIYTWHAYQLIK